MTAYLILRLLLLFSLLIWVKITRFFRSFASYFENV